MTNSTESTPFPVAGHTVKPTAAISSVASDGEIWTVGWTLIVYGLIGMVIYVTVGRVMVKNAAVLTGYRFLLSQGIGDMLLLFQFALWPGVVVLRRRAFVPVELRFQVHIYLDFTWWVGAYHYSLVAWSRLTALRDPVQFKLQSMRTSVCICAGVWLVALAQAIGEHLHPAFSIMYIDPQAYGLVFDDFMQYHLGGTERYYLIFNMLLQVVVPVVLYALTALQLAYGAKWRSKRAHSTKPRTEADGGGGAGTQQTTVRTTVRRAAARQATAQRQAEIRLLVPCMLNNAICILGQYAITNPTVAPRWIAFFVLIVFITKSVLNPIFYVVCSPAIRQQLFKFR